MTHDHERCSSDIGELELLLAVMLESVERELKND